MDWLPLTLLSALSLATADALTKRHLADYGARELAMVRFGFSGLLVAPLLLVEPLPPVPPVFWAWIGGLVPLEVLAMLLYMRAIRDAPLAHTLPYLAFTPVFVTVTGWAVLGEAVSVRGFAGILLVVAGAWALNLQHAVSGGPGGWLEPFRAIGRERGARLMLAVAAIYSLTSVMGKGAMAYVTPAVFGPFYFALLGLITVAVFGVRRPALLRVLGRRPGWHMLIGLMMGIMVITHFLAIARVEAAYMIAVKRTSLLFGILYGALWFRERHLARNLVAGAFMLAGVILIALQ